MGVSVREELTEELEGDLYLYDGQGRPAQCDATDCWWHGRHGLEGAVDLCYWFVLRNTLPAWGDRRRVADYCAAYRPCDGCGTCRTAGGISAAPTDVRR